jgi:hypothetical protein
MTTTNATHTPGPWELTQYGAVVRKDYGSQAVVYTNNGESCINGAANARLIASAPDLLAALKDILDYAYAEEEQLAHLANHEPDVYGDAHAACQGAIRIARAAIARAEGGAM